MELLIKNMVCQHCVKAVKQILMEFNLRDADVVLGKATFDGELSDEELSRLELRLNREGFELIRDYDTLVVEKTKHVVLHHIREEKEKRHNLSDCIEQHLGISYDTVSRIFSAREGRTLEKYHILQKIERVKELLQHDEYTLSEIADMVDYSSVAHLSRQFKSITGMTPTEYLRGKRERKNLPDV